MTLNFILINFILNIDENVSVVFIYDNDYKNIENK